MPEEKKKLGEILLEAGVIDKFQLKSALAEQNKWGGRLGNHLVQMGILTEDLLVKALSKQLKIPNLDLAQMMVTGDVLELVPHEIAEKFHLVPVAVKKIANKRTLIVAMSDPTNLDAVDELQFRTGHIIKPAVAGDTAIELAIRRYYYGELGPQRVAGQPIEFDSARSAQAAPEVTNVPTDGVPVPPENTFSLGEDDPPAASVAPPPAAEIPEASLADLAPMEPESTQADPAYPPNSDSGAWPPAESAPAWSAEPATDAPAWPAAEPVAEPEPYYDPDAATAPAVAADPAYDTAAEPPAWSGEPAPEAPPLEATYADAPLESVEPEPLAAEPAPYGEPEPLPYAEEPAPYAAGPEPEPYAAEPAPYAAEPEPYAAEPAPYEAEPAPYAEEAAPAWSDPAVEDATAPPAWSAPAAAPEEPYPHDEPTMPADEMAPVAMEAWSEPSASAETWTEPATTPEEPPVAEVGTDASAEMREPAPAGVEPDPTEPPELSLSEPSYEPSVLEPTNAPEISMDGVTGVAEPGPVETAVAEMEAVPSSFSPGDAVQTFLGQHDGPYEPTTPGEPTNAPDDTQPDVAIAADGGMAAAENGVAYDELNGNIATSETGSYTVPPDPLGGIPFDTVEGRAIRALCALLLEKGVLTSDELASRLRTAVEGMGGGEGNG